MRKAFFIIITIVVFAVMSLSAIKLLPNPSYYDVTRIVGHVKIYETGKPLKKGTINGATKIQWTNIADRIYVKRKGSNQESVLITPTMVYNGKIESFIGKTKTLQELFNIKEGAYIRKSSNNYKPHYRDVSHYLHEEGNDTLLIFASSRPLDIIWAECEIDGYIIKTPIERTKDNRFYIISKAVLDGRKTPWLYLTIQEESSDGCQSNTAVSGFPIIMVKGRRIKVKE